MLLIDVNILVYGFREDSPEFSRISPWLAGLLTGEQPFGLADAVLSGFLRIVTHPGIFDPPSTIERAIRFIEELQAQPHCVPVAPGSRHWSIFLDLCRTAGVRGNLVPDAYLAALAIESGSEWITTDRGFGRFPGLRWREPG